MTEEWGGRAGNRQVFNLIFHCVFFAFYFLRFIKTFRIKLLLDLFKLLSWVWLEVHWIVHRRGNLHNLGLFMKVNWTLNQCFFFLFFLLKSSFILWYSIDILDNMFIDVVLQQIFLVELTKKYDLCIYIIHLIFISVFFHPINQSFNHSFNQ